MHLLESDTNVDRLSQFLRVQSGTRRRRKLNFCNSFNSNSPVEEWKLPSTTFGLRFVEQVLCRLPFEFRKIRILECGCRQCSHLGSFFNFASETDGAKAKKEYNRQEFHKVPSDLHGMIANYRSKPWFVVYGPVLPFASQIPLRVQSIHIARGS